MKRLKGKVAIVTASTQGIGYSIAERLGLEGASVVVSSRKQANVEEAVERLRAKGIEVTGLVCHVSNAQQRKDLIDKTIQIPYHRIWHAREIAKEDVFGKVEDSYRLLPKFLSQIMDTHPDSIIDLRKTFDNCFERVFISLDACINGFLASCRPILGIDGCHLRGPYGGVLVSAVGIDDNSGLFPVCYAVVEGESGDAWTWFLQLVKKAIGHPQGLTIISDMDKGIELAVPEVFGGAKHSIYMRHMYKAFKKKWPGQAFENACWTAARCYTLRGYQA